MASVAESSRATTGIDGLDDVLHGGLIRDRLYLVEGMPGSGKTTLAFQFLMEGVRRGETSLYVTLSETEEEARAVAASHGWLLEGLQICELVPSEEALQPDEQYTVFHPSEVELTDTTQRIVEEVERLDPVRVVIDSLSELRLLAGSALRYRRQILSLKRYFAGRRCTVLLLDDMTAADHDLQVQSIAYGGLLLGHAVPAFGTIRRRLSVTKFRGSDFRAGYHDYVIRRGGLQVFPRLVASEHRQAPQRERLPSGLKGLDELMGGGIERGTSTLVQGAPGTGKSTIASLYCVHAAERGDRSALYVFDESLNTLTSRMSGLNLPFAEHVEAGRITLQQVDPAELSPGELMHNVQRAVDEGARIIVIDSLNGYLNAMPDEKFLVVQLHELLTYLGQRGVATILVAAHQGLFGHQASQQVDASYLSDTVLLLRYFEAEGEVRQAISVVKMRSGGHERTIREFSTKGGKVSIGKPLREYIGVLTGVPSKKLPP